MVPVARKRNRWRRYHCLGFILTAAPLFPERLPVTCKSLWRLMQEDSQESHQSRACCRTKERGDLWPEIGTPEVAGLKKSYRIWKMRDPKHRKRKPRANLSPARQCPALWGRRGAGLGRRAGAERRAP